MTYGLGAYDDLISCVFAVNRVSVCDSDETLSVTACDHMIVEIKAMKSRGSEGARTMGYYLSTYTFVHLPGGGEGAGGRRLLFNITVIPSPPGDSEDPCAPGAADILKPPLFVKFVFDRRN